MHKSNLNLITRRGFLDASVKSSLAVALSTLVDIPLVMKRALAEGVAGFVLSNSIVASNASIRAV